MSPTPWSPLPHEEVMAEGRLKEVSLALNELEIKMSQLKDSDFDLFLTGGALRFRLIAIAEEWLRIYRNDIDSSDAFTRDMVIDV